MSYIPKEMAPVPTIGRIVHYRLKAFDVEQINRRRTTGGSIADRIKESLWPIGAQAHIGNPVKEGDVFPMIICRAWGDTPESCVNGQVFLDGTDTFWATSVAVGDESVLGTFSWPGRP